MKVGFIGIGNMGSALARAVADGVKCSFYIYDKDTEKANTFIENFKETSIPFERVRRKYATDSEIAKKCDFIFLGVKPNVVPEVLYKIRDELAERKNVTLISMAAGVSIATIEEYLGKKIPIIRIMPNTPVAVGAGMILWCKNELVDKRREKKFLDMLQWAGELDAIDEELIDAGCAISGCGPAFVFTFIDAMAKAGEQCGLSRKAALTYAAETARGAAEYLLCSEKSPSELTDAVCSPGGSTIEGVKVLMQEGFEDIVIKAVSASYKRTKELGK